MEKDDKKNSVKIYLFGLQKYKFLLIFLDNNNWDKKIVNTHIGHELSWTC